jgi:aspartate aminotransferase-like enzyme
MRDVPFEGGRLDAVAQRASIAADLASGDLSAAYAASAGTVNAGMIDPLEALADVAAAEGLWYYVDGVYSAVGVLDPAISVRFRGMERADSATTCATRSASSRRTCARTQASRSERSPSTGSSRRDRSARSDLDIPRARALVGGARRASL